MAKFVSTDTDGTGTDSHVTSQEMDLKVTGKHGDTTVVSEFNMDGASAVTAGDQYISTTIGGVSLKAGDFIGGKSDLTKRSGRADKMSASYTAGPVKITYENNANNNAGAVYVSGTAGGVSATYKNKDGSNEIHLSTEVAGVSLAYRGIESDSTTSDRAIVKVSGTVGGVALTYMQADSETSVRVDGDGFFGDLNGSDGTTYTAATGADLAGISATMDVAGNSVTIKTVDIDAETSANDKTINSVTVVRSLAAGTTLKAKYTMTDVDAANSDTDALELKLSVAF
jgi:hypothetical protein